MSNGAISLIDLDTILKVSSTIDRSAGKKNLVDNNPETCWTSQQGSPQYIQLTFSQRVVPKRVSLTFQGGFVGTPCSIFSSEMSSDWELMTRIYPEDINGRQLFDLISVTEATGVRSMKLIFEASSDFFGRVTVYDLKIEGAVAS